MHVLYVCMYVYNLNKGQLLGSVIFSSLIDMYQLTLKYVALLREMTRRGNLLDSRIEWKKREKRACRVEGRGGWQIERDKRRGSTPLELCKKVRGREQIERRRVSIYGALSIHWETEQNVARSVRYLGENKRGVGQCSLKFVSALSKFQVYWVRIWKLWKFCATSSMCLLWTLRLYPL